jgi:hypothetical protein
MKELSLTFANGVEIMVDREGNVRVWGAKSFFGTNASRLSLQKTPDTDNRAPDLTPFHAQETH